MALPRLVYMVITLMVKVPLSFETLIQWRHNEHDGVSNHQPHDCLLNSLCRRRWKKTSKLRVTGLCAGNSPVTGEFPTQRASNAENVSIWWRHHAGTHAKILTSHHNDILHNVKGFTGGRSDQQLSSLKRTAEQSSGSGRTLFYLISIEYELRRKNT